MSRLLETLHRWQEPLSPATLAAFLQALRQQQNAHSAAMTCAFPLFKSRFATRKASIPMMPSLALAMHARKKTFYEA
jgi:hypothetical protein